MLQHHYCQARLIGSGDVKLFTAVPDLGSGPRAVKSFLLTCFSIVVTIKLVKEAAQNTIYLLSGIISRVWEFFYQHVGAGPVLDVEAGEYASVTCVDMMLRAPEDSEVSMRISGYAATSKVRLHHHWQARYLPMVMFLFYCANALLLI